MVPAINAYLDVLVEDVLPDFGVDSGQRIVKEVDVGIGIQRPGEVHLDAKDTDEKQSQLERLSTNRKINNSQASIIVTHPLPLPPGQGDPTFPDLGHVSVTEQLDKGLV